MEVTTDQEQAEQVKKWLRENGLSIILGLVIGAGGIFGWNYYKSYQHQQNLSAAKGFTEITATKPEELPNKLDQFASEHANSVYAVNARLGAASKAATGKNYVTAMKHLEWVMQNAKTEAHKLQARLDLARVNLHTGKPDVTIKLLQDVDGKSYSSQYLITLAGAYAKIGKTELAKSTYQKARLLVLDEPETQNLINMQINNLR